MCLFCGVVPLYFVFVAYFVFILESFCRKIKISLALLPIDLKAQPYGGVLCLK